jgi:hypothetical protein
VPKRKSIAREWPRCYTSTELKEIAKSIGRKRLRSLAVGKLQEAVQAYQWGRSIDYGKWGSPSTNKGRRTQLEYIIKLCERGVSIVEIDKAVDELDAPASQSP